MLPKPVQSNALTFEECECCGEVEFNMDTEECVSCGWRRPDPSADTMLCYSCGATKNPSFFLSAVDENCIACVADEMKVKRQGEKIQCGTCKQLRFADMFGETTTDGEFMCMACEVKQ